MTFRNWNLEWANLNSQRNYPLADDANATSSAGDFKIPDDFIVELDLAIHAGLDVSPDNFFIKHVGVYATGYMIVVGYQPAGDADPVDVATALIAAHLHTRNKVYVLGGVEPFYDTVGKVVIGRLDSIKEAGEGFHSFTLSATRLDPDAIRPIIRGISSITVVNNGQRSAPLFGDIELIAGNNMQLVPIQITGQDPAIRFNAISGEGTVEECICVGDEEASPPIKTIDGIGPTPTGNFNIIGDSCLDVKPIANGVQIIDKCSAPCCSCADLEAVTRDLERLKGEAEAVKIFTNQLRTAVDTMSLTVLGARLGGGCISCE